MIESVIALILALIFLGGVYTGIYLEKQRQAISTQNDDFPTGGGHESFDNGVE